jgi:transcriptional regulator GlxA family with amidase domain
VSSRTLQKAFAESRGIRPVAHVRNLRLDRARDDLQTSDASVAAIAARCGFRSSTTFAIEYRKRFGVAPSRTKRVSASE